MNQLQKRIITEGLGISDYIGDNMIKVGKYKYMPQRETDYFNLMGRKEESILAPRETVFKYEEALGINITLKYKYTVKQFEEIHKCSQ